VTRCQRDHVRRTWKRRQHFTADYARRHRGARDDDRDQDVSRGVWLPKSRWPACWRSPAVCSDAARGAKEPQTSPGQTSSRRCHRPRKRSGWEQENQQPQDRTGPAARTGRRIANGDHPAARYGSAGFARHLPGRTTERDRLDRIQRPQNPGQSAMRSGCGKVAVPTATRDAKAGIGLR